MKKTEATGLQYFVNYSVARRRGVDGRVPAFQSSKPGSIHEGLRNFNFYPVFVLSTVQSCIVSDGALPLY